jgi:hypothetical protein
MIPFEELSAALDAYAANPAAPHIPAPTPVAAAPVAAAPEPAYQPPPVAAPMYDGDKSNEIDIGDVLDDDTHHS